MRSIEECAYYSVMKQRASRFLAGLPAWLHEGGTAASCEAFDVSRGGVRLIGHLARPETREVEVTLQSVKGDLTVRVPARIVRYEGTPPDAVVALEFSGLESEQMRKIEALVARVVEGMNPAPLKALTPASTPAEIKAVLERVPLAHRIGLAKRAMSQERGYFRHDPNPRVLEALCRNPNTNIREIRELARLRHHLPTAIEAMARDPRWQRDDELHVTLATHPRVTLDTAERLIEGMDPRTRQKTLETPGLNPALRMKLLQRYG